MKISKIIVAAFLVTFGVGVFFALTTEKVNLLQNTDSMCQMRIQPRLEKTVSDVAVTEPETDAAVIKPETDEIISYKVARKYAGGKMLDEDYWEQMEDVNYKFDLLQIGEYHGNEVTARNGETWLAMYAGENGSFLKKTKLKVERVADFMTPNEKVKTGKKVSIKEKENPLFLINAKSLDEGKFKTIFRGATNEEYDDASAPTVSIDENFKQDYKIGGVKYTLRAAKVFDKESRIMFALILESGDVKQILFTTDNGEYMGRLFWVGDLDRDGKPDLYLSPWIKENVEVNTLYLSSEAEKKHFVKEVAVLGTVGC